MRRLIATILALLLLALPALAETASEDAGVSLKQARYYFEHNALPRYFYEDPANMIDVLGRNGIFRLWASFADENGVDYPYVPGDCGEIIYSTSDGATLMLLTLPQPENAPDCFRIYLVHQPYTGATGFYTVEYENFMGEAAFLCGWTEDLTHVNYGGAQMLGQGLTGSEPELLEEAQQVADLAGVSTALTLADESLPTGIETTGLSLIECPQLGFTTMADPALAWEYEEGTGIYIYTETAGSIPYVIVFRTGDIIAEPLDYIREQYTPYIQKQYGDNLVATAEYEVYDIGGKSLPAGSYTYRLQGHLVTMLRLYDVSDTGTAIYTAKTIDGDDAATLSILDTAVRCFRGK